MDEQIEIQKQFRQQQEKYVYYLIALAVAAIGFSVVKTADQSLRWSQLSLGAAVLSWGVSIYCGLSFLQYGISTLFANNAYFDILQGKYPSVGTHPERIEAAIKGITQAMETNSNRGTRFAKWQNRLFYLGIIFFLGWHVWEMIIRTKQ